MGKGANTTCDEGQTLIPTGGFFDEPAKALRAQSNLKHREDCDTLIPILEVGKGSSSRGEGPNGTGIGEDGDPMYTLQAGAQHAIAHALSAEGADASEDGARRGVPLIAETLRNHPRPGSNSLGAIAFDSTQVTSKGNRSNPKPGDPCHTLHKPHDTLLARAMSVRRLTPKECLRLQGFPDDYLDILYRGKPAADGPKYKAVGNSMAVLVMRWIGRRIQLVENMK